MKNIDKVALVALLTLGAHSTLVAKDLVVGGVTNRHSRPNRQNRKNFREKS